MKRIPLISEALASTLLILFIIAIIFTVPGCNSAHTGDGTQSGQETGDSTKHSKAENPHNKSVGPVAISGVVKEMLPDDGNNGLFLDSYGYPVTNPQTTTIYIDEGGGSTTNTTTVGGAAPGDFTLPSLTTTGNLVYLDAYRKYALTPNGTPTLYANYLLEFVGPNDGVFCGISDPNLNNSNMEFYLTQPGDTVPCTFLVFNKASCGTVRAGGTLYIYTSINGARHGVTQVATGAVNNNGVCSSLTATAGGTYNLLQNSTTYYVAYSSMGNAYQFETSVLAPAGVPPSTACGLTVIFEY